MAAAAGDGAPGAAETGTVTAEAQPVAEKFQAYGQVVPIALVSVRAAEAGIVADMRVVPGSPARAGEALATLTGPEIHALLVGREGAVRAARVRLLAERRQLAGQLSTQQSVAAARAAFESAQAQLQVARDMTTLRAPSPATVIAVNAGEGERVGAGQIVLTLQASNRLWLNAIYYGEEAAAIHVGMRGRFQPAGGGAPVPVKVAAVSAALAPDEGESVGLFATGPHARDAASQPPWLSGEWGTVTLEGATHSMVAVPTRALIIDRGQWWVLVRTPHGDRRQPVAPGPTRGWQTFIRQGLASGEQVVVQNPYLEFHRGIVKRYAPPD